MTNAVVSTNPFSLVFIPLDLKSIISMCFPKKIPSEASGGSHELNPAPLLVQSSRADRRAPEGGVCPSWRFLFDKNVQGLQRSKKRNCKRKGSTF